MGDSKEWERRITVKKCSKCQKWGHNREQFHSRASYCRYCASMNKHNSSDCPDINNTDSHKCINCKNVKIIHCASDRCPCRKFLEYYMAICSAAKINPDPKYIKCQKELESKLNRINNNNNKSSSNHVDKTMENTTERFARMLHIQKQLIGDNCLNYTQIIDEVLDNSVIQKYHDLKDTDGNETETFLQLMNSNLHVSVNISILTLNCKGYNNNRDYVLKLCADNSILFLTETRMNEWTNM